MAWWWRSCRVDADHAWQRQNNEQQHNVLYTFVNLQRQGRLVDVYRAQGLHALNTVIRDELAVFLYNGGKGKLVDSSESSEWECDADTNVRYLRISSPASLSVWSLHVYEP